MEDTPWRIHRTPSLGGVTASRAAATLAGEELRQLKHTQPHGAGTPLLCVDGRVERSGVYNTQQDAAGKKSAVDVYDVEAIDIDAK